MKRKNNSNFLGEGFYYRVFDAGDGRVEKKLTSYWSRVRKLLLWGRTEEIGLWQVLNPRVDRRRFVNSIKKSQEVLKKLGGEIFGNPLFFGLEYQQDKAVQFDKYLEQLSLEQQKRLFDEYLVLAKTLWRHGYADSVYNFMWNNGVSLKTGKLVFIDFNEFASSKEKIHNDIDRKKWRTQYAMTSFPLDMKELKTYILEAYDRELTHEALDSLWNNA